MAKKRGFGNKRGFMAKLNKIVTSSLQRHGLINNPTGVRESTKEDIGVKRQQFRGVEVSTISQKSLMRATPATTQTMTQGAQAMQRAKQFAGSEAETAYTYGALTKSLAAKILQSGGDIPPAALQAAEIAAAGRGDIPENVVLDQLRGALGIERSGASFVQQITGQVRGAVRSASNAGILISAAGQGGAIGAAAQGQILQTFFDKADALTKNKLVQSIATKIGETLGGDSLAGSRFLYAASRGLALGGAVAAVALAAWQTGESYFSNQNRMAQARGAGLDATRQAFMATPVLGREERLREERTASQAASIYDQGMAALGFGGNVAEAQARAVAQNANTVLKASAYAASLGIDVGGLLAQAAAEKGKSVAQLNSYERSAALNKAVTNRLKDLRNSDAAGRYAEAKMRIEGDLLQDVQNRTGLGGQVAKAFLQARHAARIQELRAEYAKKEVERPEKKREEIEEVVRKYQDSLSPEQNLQIETAIRDENARRIAYASRHKVRWDD